MHVAMERTPAEIQREIEQARVNLASAVDQLAVRTSPKRLAAQAKATLMEKAMSPQGKKAIGGSVAAILVILILARVRKARARR
jgi:hypothetical protein